MNHHLAETLVGTISKSILDTAQYISLAPGQYVTRASQPISHFYVMAKGTVKLIYEDASASPLIIDLYHAGDFFGEMEMLGMNTDDRSIVTLTNCELYQFSKEQFFHMWNQYSEFSRYILYVHCERLIRAGNDKIHSERMVLREKVFRIIQDHLNEANYFMYTKDILAEMAGVSIRSLNRSLVELEDLKLVKLSSGTIRLHL